MKRSEMIKVIRSSLVENGIFSDDIDSWLEDAATDLLKDIEKAGMLPPEIEITDKTRNGRKVTYKSNSWESEDEENA